MIASVTGPVQRVTSHSCVISVAGFGFEIAVPSRSLLGLRIGQDLTLNTSLIVREDSLTLFGFESLEELETFELLISVSGIGPRMALAILGALTVDEVAKAVSTQDDRKFTLVSGIGPKTAKMIVVSLSGKFSNSGPENAPSNAVDEQTFQDVLAALVGLGMDERTANSLLQEAIDATPEPSRDALLKKALSISAGRRAGR